jgi:hypothetical protein
VQPAICEAFLTRGCRELLSQRQEHVADEDLPDRLGFEASSPRPIEYIGVDARD